MKIIDKNYIEKTGGKRDLLRIYREIEIMSALKHENILQVIEGYQLTYIPIFFVFFLCKTFQKRTFFTVFESDNHIVIILELAERGEIYDLIEEKGRLEEDEARYFFKQLLSSLAYLHSVSIWSIFRKSVKLLLTGGHCT